MALLTFYTLAAFLYSKIILADRDKAIILVKRNKKYAWIRIKNYCTDVQLYSSKFQFNACIIVIA